MHSLLFYVTVLFVHFISSFKLRSMRENIRPVVALYSLNPRILKRTHEKLNSLHELISNLPDTLEKQLAEECLEVAPVQYHIILYSYTLLN